jgi:predicted permease
MVYGLENMGVFARLGIGHEFFFWMFFLTFLDRDFGGRKKFRSTLLSLAKSPGVIAIVAGIALSLFRVGPHVEGSEILRGIRGALQALASLASPLVLLSVGYGIRFQKGQLKKAFAFTGLRIASTLSLGFLLKTQLVDRLYPRTPLMDHGFFLLFVLPPIFSLSLFISPHSNSDEIALANNVIVLYTLYTLTSFIAYALAFPPV